MGVIRETIEESGLTVVSAWPEYGTPPAVLFEGGWKQNPDLMERMLTELASGEDVRRGRYASIGFSAFDTIPPFTEVDSQEIRATLDEDPILKDINPRMVKRAVLLGSMAQSLLASDEAPFSRYDAAVAHCAGANVHLLSRYLHLEYGIGESLPSAAVLVEPMIAEGQRVMRVAKDNGNHEKKAAEDASFISLQSMQAQTDQPKDGMAAAKPLKDILGSRGVSLLAANVERGDEYRIILGEHDIAAPKDVTIDQMAALGIKDIVTLYSAQERFGHGYLLEETVPAVKAVAQALESLELRQIVKR